MVLPYRRKGAEPTFRGACRAAFFFVFEVIANSFGVILISAAAVAYIAVSTGQFCSDSNPNSLCSQKAAKALYQENYPNMIQQMEHGQIVDYRLLLLKDVWAHAKNVFAKSPKVEKININIKFSDLKKLNAQRDSAIRRGVFMNEEQGEYVNATFDFRSNKYKAQIRLKGKTGDHWDDAKKMSLRVKIKNGNLEGLTRFSLQHPKTRNYFYSSLIGHLAEAMGVVYPKSFYVDAMINGEPIGIMQIEEHFDRHTAANHSLREGFFFKQAGIDFGGYSPGTMEGRIVGNTLFYPLESIGRTNDKLYEKNKSDYVLANSLFRSFSTGDLPANEVFDLDNVARALALVSLFNAGHSLVPGNMYMYFNSVTKKFEMIPCEYDAAATAYDFMMISNIGNPDYVVWLEIFKKIIDVQEFQILFKKHSKEITDYLVEHTESIQNIIDSDYALLRTEFSLLPALSLTRIIADQKKKADLIARDGFFGKTQPEVYRKDVKAKIPGINFGKPVPLADQFVVLMGEGSKGHRLEFINKLTEPRVVNEFVTGVNCKLKLSKELVSLDQAGCESLIAHGMTLRPATRVVSTDDLLFLAKPVRQALQPVEIPNAKAGDKLTLFLRTNEAEQLYLASELYYSDARPPQFPGESGFRIYPAYPFVDHHPLQESAISEILAGAPYLDYDSAAKTIRVRKGNWTVDRFIIPPVGVGLSIPAGTHLAFTEEAGVVLQGSLKIKGDKEARVVLDAENPAKGWRGLTVLKANAYGSEGGKSFVELTDIKNTNFAMHGAWGLTGGTTFYESDVLISDTAFVDSQAEDALNIVRSKFEIIRASFEGSRSDAFDADFAKGAIEQSRFSHIGGDGIDFSGSTISAADSSFDHIHDKAISVGENTHFTGERLTVSYTTTGVACKDGSHATIRDSRFDHMAHSTLMAYIKKPAFGGATLIASNLAYEDGDFAIVAQKKSSIMLDGRKIPRSSFDVEKLYKEGYMKK